MSSAARRSTRGSHGAETTSHTVTTNRKGLFDKGIWLCTSFPHFPSYLKREKLTYAGDCTPRLPAEHFRVKKEGPNHGRWFYTCQGQETNDNFGAGRNSSNYRNAKRCGFFLWDEDANPRMKAAIVGGGIEATEPAEEGGLANISANTSGYVVVECTPEEQGNGSPMKRKRPGTGTGTEHPEPTNTESEEEIYPWSLTQREGTPPKRVQLPTPNITPQKPRPEPVTPQKQRGIEPMTPTSRTIGTRASSKTEGNPADDLAMGVHSVFAAHGHDLPWGVREDLDAFLQRHTLRAQGIVKGRDVAREAVRRRDETIERQRVRIEGLEGEVASLRALRNMRSKNDADN